ncbi:MAG: PaaI family thioesterase [Formivibrio sp.]|nr:PaaI family thioesterase [Formivibrio sp.]
MEPGWLPVAAPEFFAQIVKRGLALPHCRALGLQLQAASHGKTTLMLPFKPEWVGNPFTRVLHGGVVTTLADSAGAVSIFTRLCEPESIATLDLRIDYLRPGLADLPLYCQAECYQLTSQIAFTRSTLYQQDPEKPIAHAVATYMRSVVPNGGGADAVRP